MNAQLIFDTLHNMPEKSGEEIKTSEFIVQTLREYGIQEIYENAGYHSILAVIRGTTPGKNIIFRSELDAVYMNNRIFHGCGHDGHMLSLLLLAYKLINKPFPGHVGLLFQSAEENGKGARAVIDSGVFEYFTPDYIFAFHNIPGFQPDTILIREHTFSAFVETILFTFQQPTTHASVAHHESNSLYQASQLINFSTSLCDHNPGNFFLATPVSLKSDTCSFGSIPEKAELALTIRSFDHTIFHERKKMICEYAEQLNQHVQYSFADYFPAIENDIVGTEILLESISNTSLRSFRIPQPFRWGEDFGFYSQIFPSVMFGIGNGIDSAELHSEKYAFHPEIPEKLVQLCWNIIHVIAKK